MTTGQAGAAVGHTGSRMGTWLTANKEDPVYDLVATKYPVLEKGDIAMFGQRQAPFFGISIGISSNCDDVEAAMRFLDFGYGEEGHMLYNFGIEGESYEMVDGYPKYTDFVTNNPDGKSMSEVLRGYTKSVYNGPIIQDRRYMEQYAQYEQQKDAIEKWMMTDATKYLFPPVTYTTEENTQTAAAITEIKDYVNEIFLKVMFGDIDIENEWDNYIKTLEQLGLQDVLDVQNSALERFNSR